MLLGGITLLGALLRAWSPGRIGVWRDEAQLLDIGSLPSYGAICRFLFAHESHPPLMYFLAHVTHGATGLSALVLFCAIAAIPLTFMIGRVADSDLAGLLASAALAFSLPVIFDSVQLRPYGVLATVLALLTLALMKAVCDDRPMWRSAWAASSLIALYLHHVAVLVLAAQIGAVFMLSLIQPAVRASARRWLYWLAAVAVLAVPDLHLLSRQAQSAGHLAAGGGLLLFPWRILGHSALGHPAVLLLPLLSAVVLLRLPRAAQVDSAATRAWLVVVSYLLLLLFMTIATYRAGFLAVQIIVMTAALSLVLPSIVVARLWRSGHVFWCAAALEALILTLGIDGVGWWGYAKANTQEVAKFVSAESSSTDLLILAPGSLGTSFNFDTMSRLSQLDFPFVGAVQRYPFDHHFARMVNPAALRVVQDSVAAASAAGRRIWMVMQADWVLPRLQPEVLDERKFSGLGAVDASRANLLRQRLHAQFGEPVSALYPTQRMRSAEALQAELFSSRKRHE
jgi:hypothetical protein